LGIKGALNPDMSIHGYYSEHKNGSTKEATKSARLLNEPIELKAPKKVYVGE